MTFPGALEHACTAIMDFKGLHVIADDDPARRHGPEAVALAACRGGARVVQLRAKHSGDREALRLAREIRACTRAHGVAFIVNDRIDIALPAQADGVHLGQDDLPPGAIPEALRARLAVGRSTHDPAQMQRALREGANYIAFGPLFDTASKETQESARGEAALRALARALREGGDGGRAKAPPLIAIGGIDAARAARALRAGADGVAVIAAVAEAERPVPAVRELAAACGRGA